MQQAGHMLTAAASS